MLSWLFFYFFSCVGILIVLKSILARQGYGVMFGIVWTLMVYAMMGKNIWHTRSCVHSDDVVAISIAGVELTDPAVVDKVMTGLRRYQPNWDESWGVGGDFTAVMQLVHADGSKDLFRLEHFADDNDMAIMPLDSEDEHTPEHGEAVIGLAPVLKDAGARLPLPGTPSKVVKVKDDESVRYYTSTLVRKDDTISVFGCIPADSHAVFLATFDSKGRAHLDAGWWLGKALEGYQNGFKPIADSKSVQALYDELTATEGAASESEKAVTVDDHT